MTRPKLPSQTGCNKVQECIESCNPPSLFVEEKGVAVTFSIPRARQARKIRYDGCYNQNPDQLKADYIVGLATSIDVITELKSSDLRHARDQVEHTLLRWKTDPIRFHRIACLIVYARFESKQKKAGRIPVMNSRIQSLEREFLRTQRTLLLIRQSSSAQLSFDEFFRKSEFR